MDTKFLLRKNTGDQPIAAETDLREALQKGQCRPSDFLYEFATSKWCRLGDHPSLASFFADKPPNAPDRRVIYFLPPGGAGAPPLGPFSTKEIQQRAQNREICASTWVFVEGDKEWRQVKNVKILHDMLPALPADQPAPPAPPPAEAPVAAAPAADAPPPFSLGGDAPFAPPSVSSLQPETPITPPVGISFPEPPAHPSMPANPANVGLATVPMPAPEMESPSMPSIKLDLGMAVPPPAPSRPAGATATNITAPPPSAPAQGNTNSPDLDDPHIEREEVTMALDTMGLKLHSQHASLPPAPPPAARPAAKPAGLPPSAPPKAAPAAAPAAELAASGLSIGSNPAIPRPGAPAAAPAAGKPKEVDTFDGIVAEIPTDPVWMVKQATSETISGPFRFLEVVKFLEEGKLTKNDKIARAGTKAFVKIAQQYEFNVKFSIESVMENGHEKQKILIRRRHPRVPYITGVQIVSKLGLLAGQCVNISAGGILMEAPKAEFNLGDIIEIKILPGLIAKSITCKSLIIGKIPKIPPGYALKFEDLKQEDKEAIEYYVQETLKREMSKKV